MNIRIGQKLVTDTTWKAVFLLGYPLISPFVVLLRQYFEFLWAGDIAKVYSALALIVFSGDFLKALKNSRPPVLLLIGILCYALLVSTFIGRNYIPSIESFLPHFIGYCSLLLVAGAFRRDVFVEFIRISKRLVYINLIIHGVVAGFYFADPLGLGGYEGFNSSGLIPTFVVSLISGNYLTIFLHLIAMFFMGKRAVLYICLLVFLLHFVMRMFHANRFQIKNLLIIVGTISVLAAGVVVVSVDKEKFAFASRSFEAVSMLAQGDLPEEGSLEEKLSEGWSLYTQVLDTPINLVSGVGLGWSYTLDSPFKNYEENSDRHYVHFTPIFFHATLGLFGLTLYALLLFFSFQASFFRGEELKYVGYFLLIQIGIGLTRLNIFTEPAIQYMIGGLLYMHFHYKYIVSECQLKHMFFGRTERWVAIALPILTTLSMLIWLHTSKPIYEVTLDVAPSWTSASLLSYDGGTDISSLTMPQSADFLIYLDMLASDNSLDAALAKQPIHRWAMQHYENWKIPLLPADFNSLEAWFQNYISQNIGIYNPSGSVLAHIEIRIDDPAVGRAILYELHKNTDALLRHRSIEALTERIQHFTILLAQTNNIDKQHEITQLLTNYEKSKSEAEASTSFAAETIGPPVSSLYPVRPNPPVILLLVFLTTLIVLIFIFSSLNHPMSRARQE